VIADRKDGFAIPLTGLTTFYRLVHSQTKTIPWQNIHEQDNKLSPSNADLQAASDRIASTIWP
jgi:hypothetical protein